MQSIKQINLSNKMLREIVGIIIAVMIMGKNEKCECCVESERYGLLQIKSSFLSNHSAYYISSWGTLDADCCNWDGVYCDSATGHVTVLNLAGSADSDEYLYMNASVFLPFQQLNYLNLMSNNIAGCIHNHGFERLSTLANLETLRFTSNKFNNSVLPSLAGLPSLKGLYLDYNKLDGIINISALNNTQELDFAENKIESFEDTKVKFSRLRYLDLRRNRLNSSTFPFLRQLLSLRTLDLTGNPLNHNIISILQSIGAMGSLENLFLEDCGLSGNMATNSKELCNLKHLQRLYASCNDLSGNLPPCLSSLTSLQSLDLSFNRFRIPISLAPFFNISQLKILDVSGNTMYADIEYHSLKPGFQLEELYIMGYGEGGTFPEFLHHQRNLQKVYISSVKLEGGFPHWLLENNTRLSDLYLSNNSLSGPIQLPTHAHVNLKFLGISHNFFDGSIPAQIGVFLPSLSSLIMSKNEFRGTIPDSLCRNTKLNFFIISQNKISGTISNCFANMSQLQYLDVSNNDIYGNLPSNFSSPTLALANLSKNRLDGTLDVAFCYNTNLVVLDLSHNNFSGGIPMCLGELSELTFLVLGYNNFHGEMPTELCKLRHLSFLDLSHNTISGHMVPCLNISSSKSRQPFLASLPNPLLITIKGRTYSYEGEIMKFISGIDVSSNNLTGHVPLDTGNFRYIKLLNLSHNSFTGTIPVTLSNLNDIESLDLSFNRLQGAIPPQLTQLTALSSFNVSYNNLSGPTPNRVAQFATFDDNSSYIGNPFLCGWPLSKGCDTSGSSGAIVSPTEEKRNNRFIHKEDFLESFGLAYTTVLSTLVVLLCINVYWRRIWFYYVQMSIDKISYFINQNVIPIFSRF